MTTAQWEFLKESDTSLGLFYPLHYIVAGYPDLDAARDAEAAFRAAGTDQDDVRTATGEFVTRQLEARTDEDWLTRAKARLVKLIGTEMRYLHEDRNHARKGGAFLFAYTPDDDALERARQVFTQHVPLFARRYLRVAVEIVVEQPRYR